MSEAFLSLAVRPADGGDASPANMLAMIGGVVWGCANALALSQA